MPSHCSYDCSYSRNETRHVNVSDRSYDQIKEALRKIKQEKREEKAKRREWHKRESNDLEKRLEKLRKEYRSLEE